MLMHARARWALLVGVLAAAAVLMAQPAFAHLPGRGMCSTKLPAKTQLRCAQKAYYHATGTVVWIGKHKTRTTQSVYPQVAGRFREMLADHLWLSKAAKGWIAQARVRLLPPRPAHYDLWMCIHGDPAYRSDGRGEGSWGATNPNGHYNGLQMTWGWGELEGNPNNYSPMQVIWAAEHAYAANGYSRAWLQGQWGQTISPCWGYAA